MFAILLMIEIIILVWAFRPFCKLLTEPTNKTVWEATIAIGLQAAVVVALYDQIKFLT